MNDIDKESIEKSIFLIGPMGVGKTTIARELGRELKMPVLHVDDIRWEFFKAIGYSREAEREAFLKRGIEGKNEYWRPFELELIKYIASELKSGNMPPHIVDFGAGQTVYDNYKMREEAQEAFSPFKNVYLISISEDEKANNIELLKRMEHRQYRMTLSRNRRAVEKGEKPRKIGMLSRITKRMQIDSDEIAMNEHFATSSSNKSLASHIVYTGKADVPEIVKGIVKLYKGQLMRGEMCDGEVKIIKNIKRIIKRPNNMGKSVEQPQNAKEAVRYASHSKVSSLGDTSRIIKNPSRDEVSYASYSQDTSAKQPEKRSPSRDEDLLDER